MGNAAPASRPPPPSLGAWYGGIPPMLDKTIVSEFSHVKPGDTPWRSDGLRDFFL